MRLIDLYLFKKYMNRDSVIIQDEFFLQSSSFGPEEMLYYAENMPDLEGVVILEPKAEIIDRRIIGRKKIHYLHRNYAKESDSYEKLRDRILPEYEKKLDGIKKSGTRILLLDIEQSPEDNAEKILEFSLNS
jgi:thymidylate kinase